MNNADIEKNTERLFAYFIQQDDPKKFLIGLTDYISFLQKQSLFQKIFSEWEKHELGHYRKIIPAEKKAIADLRSIGKDFIKQIETEYSIKETPGDLSDGIKDLKLFLAGDIIKWTGKLKSDEFFDDLMWVAYSLGDLKKYELLKKFVDLKTGRAKFYNCIKEREELTRQLDHARKTEVWGSWSYINKIPILINDPDGKSPFLETPHDKVLQNQCVHLLLLFHTDLPIRDKKEIIDNLREAITRIHNYLLQELSAENITKHENDAKHLKSIQLISEKFDPDRNVFLVLDEHYDLPHIRCATFKNGKPTYIKMLYDLSYSWGNAPNKGVSYDPYLADNINNGLFKRRAIKKYLRTNGISKTPTLVKKSESSNLLVRTGEVIVETKLVKEIPSHYQQRFIDKTN